ncbi:MAG: hypothetical protein IJK34_10060 [Clostridia bacterium]|nr:hypothetical protein [Clostridia bacterium]
MQKESETPNFSNTPGFAGPVGRVELLGGNNSVCVSIEFDSEKKFMQKKYWRNDTILFRFYPHIRLSCLFALQYG